MKIGNVVCLSSVAHKGPNISVTYSMEKGYLGSFLFLGACKKADAPAFDLDAAMKRLGWAPIGDWAPEAIERAAKAIHGVMRNNMIDALRKTDHEPTREAQLKALDAAFPTWSYAADDLRANARGLAKAALEVL